MKSSFVNDIKLCVIASFAIVIVILSISTSDLYKMYKHRSNEISDVNSLIMSDARCRKQFKQMQIPDLVDYLRYVHRMSLHFKDHRLNVIANDERSKMVSDLINELRERTDDSLGSNPELWINKYGYDSTNAAVQRAPPEK